MLSPLLLTEMQSNFVAEARKLAQIETTNCLVGAQLGGRLNGAAVAASTRTSISIWAPAKLKFSNEGKLMVAPLLLLLTLHGQRLINSKSHFNITKLRGGHVFRISQSVGAIGALKVAAIDRRRRHENELCSVLKVHSILMKLIIITSSSS